MATQDDAESEAVRRAGDTSPPLADVRRTVDAWPPLTEGTAERLRLLLAPDAEA